MGGIAGVEVGGDGWVGGGDGGWGWLGDDVGARWVGVVVVVVDGSEWGVVWGWVEGWGMGVDRWDVTRGCYGVGSE